MTEGWSEEQIQVLDRECGPRGEMILRARARLDPSRKLHTIYEIVFNGILLMESGEKGTEQALARWALEPLSAGGALRVLVGGLGLGFTLAAVLANPAVSTAVVVEIEEVLFRWLSGPMCALEHRVLDDPRVVPVLDDVVHYIKSHEKPFDALLLDVDNGPDELALETNRWLYSREGLETCWSRLVPGGILGIWSRSPAPALLTLLREHFQDAEERVQPVQRGGKTLRYCLYRARASG